ncbi:TetR/AcrR family transcriptional regulator [Flagellimonas taeanensis]|uniref:TetR/AcrR family transcriptional regulator n=1 Tax=Flavobacteriaceae TaxID=49546 RepID=UPI000E68304C|nr:MULTISPECIES: TetR family transcriptional regulator C-terminal domain-containing protein [Allomuricauda]MDC6386121.1 TetR family transcriptional regulator C-terminal domain-containing protein [Muricauda sp. SK9]MEE1963654.1 TetR family transcriptional regulator C-terminal domain-containing protein [Allomuricauda taeanensis]RIV50354.1 TetR/AcrR family transcriptional regulator [Allomuricauda taeanensis]
MAKKKNFSKQQIITWFMDYILEQDQEPSSVYKFCKTYNLDESSFYDHFGSFGAIKSSIFSTFLDHTLELLQKDETYANSNARNQLLSFYYTFFEILTANRSYVVLVLRNKKQALDNLKTLYKLREGFTGYVDSLDIKTLDIDQEQIKKFQRKAISESAWAQLLFTLKFWLDDNSPSFEKTDILIEKSVNSSFDVLEATPLQSLVDLGKFIFKEKMAMS